MGQNSPPSSKDTILHFCHRTEIAWGRGEILRMVAESIEAKDAPTARALMALSEEIVAECEASMAYLEALMAPTQSASADTPRMKLAPHSSNG